jgi:hypothetical protein
MLQRDWWVGFADAHGPTCTATFGSGFSLTQAFTSASANIPPTS